jgi:hypothetical protein
VSVALHLQTLHPRATLSFAIDLKEKRKRKKHEKKKTSLRKRLRFSSAGPQASVACGLTGGLNSSLSSSHSYESLNARPPALASE